MPFITQGKTNWKFLVLVIILAIIVGGMALLYFRFPPEPLPNLTNILVDGKTEKLVGMTLPISKDEAIYIVKDFCESKYPSYQYDYEDTEKIDNEWRVKIPNINCVCGATINEQTGETKCQVDIISIDETADWGTYWNEEYGYGIKHPNDWEFAFSEGKVASIKKLNCSLLIYKTTEVYTNERIKDCLDMTEKYGQGYCSFIEKTINDINFKIIGYNVGGQQFYFANTNNNYFYILLDDTRFSFHGGEPIPSEFFNCEPFFDKMLSTFSFIDKIKTGKVEINYEEINKIQQSVDEGHQPWRLNPIMVVMSEAYLYGFNEDNIKILSVPDAATQNKFGTEITKINLTISHGSKAYIMTLIQPITGVGKIWTISEIELAPM